MFFFDKGNHHPATDECQPHQNFRILCAFIFFLFIRHRKASAGKSFLTIIMLILPQGKIKQEGFWMDRVICISVTLVALLVLAFAPDIHAGASSFR
jgi:hypothetical protein